MVLRILSVLFLFFLPFGLTSQVLPKEGSKLNYRLIGFWAGPNTGTKNAGKCTIEISKGSYGTISSFDKNIIKVAECEKGRVIMEVPSFGCDYTWAAVYAGDRAGKKELHHFSTLMNPKVDTATRRLRIVTDATQYKDAYVFVDCNQVLYDMNGNPVWFLPDSSFLISESTNVRDMKLSPQGTITFMIDGEVYETDYGANILWKGPNTGEVSGDSTELYHHEFTRQRGGHYMVLGGENVMWAFPGLSAGQARDRSDLATGARDTIAGKDGLLNPKMNFGTVIEYDEKGKVVWSWKSSGYFKGSDLFNNDEAGRIFDLKDVHENSFFFDDKEGVVYVSFRNISRIVKVKYPEGTVEAVYGNIYKPGLATAENDLFCGQHSVLKSREGYLCLFNNNALAEHDFPRLIMMQEPTDKDDTLNRVWEYTCTLEGLSDRELNTYKNFNTHRHIRQIEKRPTPLKLRLTSGGSISELPAGSLFASMNGPFSKIFIVTRDKKEVWNAVPEQIPPKDSVWKVFPTYRASIITDHKMIEKLIWQTGRGKE